MMVLCRIESPHGLGPTGSSVGLQNKVVRVFFVVGIGLSFLSLLQTFQAIGLRICA